MSDPQLIKSLIQNAIDAKKVRLRFLGRNDVMPRGMLQCKLWAIEKGHIERELLHNAQEGRAVCMKGKEAYFLPVEPTTRGNYLVHRGAIINGGNNLENLERLGVFGNPDARVPTYLQIPGACVAIDGNPTDEQAISLFVDIPRLLRYRSIFIDPETIDGSAPEAKIGESYFVLGGIPARAITSFKTREPSEYCEIDFAKQ